jgi:hypothetical protein
MAIVILLGLQVSGLRMMDPPLPPDVLTAKAQEIIRTLGYAERPVDHAAQWYYNTDFTDYVASHDVPQPDWAKVLSEPPLVLQYAYRQSPVYLDADQFQDLSLTPGVIQFDDPRTIQSEMITPYAVERVSGGPCRLCYARATAKTSWPNCVISLRPCQEARSALHHVF